MTLPKPQFDPEGERERERERRQSLVDEFIALRERIHARRPDLTSEEWAALADEWSEAVSDGLRNRMRALEERSDVNQTSCE